MIGRLLSWARKSTVTNLDGSLALWRELYGGRESRGGIAINPATAIEVSAVLACVRVLANGVSQVPFGLYRSADGVREPARDHALYDVLHRRPNPTMTSFEWRETAVWHIALAGFHVSLINRVGSAREVRELLPIEPGRVRIDERDGLPVVSVQARTGGGWRALPSEAVLLIRGPSWNGVTALDPIKAAREAVGLAIAAERSQADFHRNGAKTTGLYSVEGTLTAEQYRQLREWFEREIGATSAFRPLILDRGARYSPLTMTGVDAQHLETRKYQVEEVCRHFGVLPIMVGHADRTLSYASSEQMFLHHVVHGLMPWYERIEQAIDVQLLTDAERRAGLYVKFRPNGLMRGAARDRAEFYRAALGTTQQPGWMTVDEVRGLEELNPLGGRAAELTPLITQDGDADDEEAGDAAA